MRRYAYRILNVFADGVLTGNPLCVFEDAAGLSEVEMQALALQFNLSETTFILPSTVATARVRIFTPSFEMPFAGHPTLGTAHVVRDLQSTADTLTLDMRAGVTPVTSSGNVWTLEARKPTARAAAAEHDIATMFGPFAVRSLRFAPVAGHRIRATHRAPGLRGRSSALRP